MSEPTRIHSAGVQCLGGELRTLDFVIGSVGQHVTPHAGEVLILPFDAAKYLVTTRPTRWQPLIIVPDIVPTRTDGATGLDITDVVVSTVWGIAPSGVVYWNDAGVDGADVATVTYASGSGLATFDGGYGARSVSHPALTRQLKNPMVWWKDSGYERVDFTLHIDHEGNATRWIDVPKEKLQTLDAISRLSISDHPDLTVSWAEHQGGTMIKVTGAKPTQHPNPLESIVVTYWCKP